MVQKLADIVDVNVDSIFDEIRGLVVDSRNKVYIYVNVEMLNLYWHIGKIIMEIQDGEQRANYGDNVIQKLADKLTNEFGKGFSVQNLRRMRQFYFCFRKRSTVSSELSWSHYLELIKIDEDNKRSFYLKECINSKWSVRELRRQIASLLFERISISKDKEKILELALEGQVLRTGKDLVKDPFVLEFLDIKEKQII